MRTFPAISLSLALTTLFIGLAPSCSSHDESCAPGQQVTCPCAGGGTGVQVCSADGSGYDACQACVTTPAGDASPDAPLDASTDAAPEAPLDASTDAEPDAPPDGGTGCVYPTDGLGDATWPQPTAGSCQGNTAYTCDPALHQMVGVACAAGDVCATYELTESPDPATYSQPGRTYLWAGCIPAGAAPCQLTFTPRPGDYPSGEWSAPPSTCVGDDISACTTAPILDDPTWLFDLNGGTTTGYVAVTDCGAGQQCVEAQAAPTLAAVAGCYASPLVSCSPNANSACDGDVLQSCFGVPYQQDIDCAAMGQVCRLDCDIGLSYQPAECRPPLTASEVACDPTSFVPSCDGSGNIVQCDDSFQVAGQCQYYVQSHSCDSLGCYAGSGYSYDCTCANVTTSTGTVAQCLSASTQLCDPATTPDSCAGTSAQTCIGYYVDRDCSTYGEVCQVADGHAGCVAPALTTCDPTDTITTCSGNTLSGCCPASGTFQSNAYSIPCAPGYEVSFDCTTLYTAFTCQSFTIEAQCGM